MLKSEHFIFLGYCAEIGLLNNYQLNVFSTKKERSYTYITLEVSRRGGFSRAKSEYILKELVDIGILYKENGNIYFNKQKYFEFYEKSPLSSLMENTFKVLVK